MKEGLYIAIIMSLPSLYSNYIVGETNTLRINGVVADNAGEYRCAYEVQDDVYLYSDFGELDYLEEGMITRCLLTLAPAREGYGIGLPALKM